MLLQTNIFIDEKLYVSHTLWHVPEFQLLQRLSVMICQWPQSRMQLWIRLNLAFVIIFV